MDSLDMQAAKVKVFRQSLLDSGLFVHGNSVGELVAAEGKVWVGTSYAMREMRVTVWYRPGGTGHMTDRFTVRAGLADLDTLKAAVMAGAESGAPVVYEGPGIEGAL